MVVEVVIAASPAGFAVSCLSPPRPFPLRLRPRAYKGSDGARVVRTFITGRYCHCLNLIGRRTFGLSRATNQLIDRHAA
jgi:hypothetical protein